MILIVTLTTICFLQVPRDVEPYPYPSQGLMEAGTWVTDTDACEVHWFLNHTVGKADVWWLFGDKKLIY